MCTWITEQAAVTGSGKGAGGWFPVSQANVGYDHPFNAPFEHAVLLDFSNPGLGASARVAVEMNLASARSLVDTLQAAIRAAELSGVTE